MRFKIPKYNSRFETPNKMVYEIQVDDMDPLVHLCLKVQKVLF